MSILRIPSLKKMYGTTEFATDRNMGQLYIITDIDVTPINLFGGIPDEKSDGHITESTQVPPKTPQAMSTPVTEVPKSLESVTVPPDSIPLPTPRMPTRHQEEETWTSSSTLSDPSVSIPHFNVHRANVRVTSLFLVWKRVKVLSMMMNMNELFIEYKK